jgi:DNA polymerase
VTKLSAITLDFETASMCDLKKAGAWRYSEDLSTEIICLAFEDIGGKGDISTWTPHDVQGDSIADGVLRAFAADPNVTFIAHNAAFEKAIWRNIMVPVYGFPDIPNSRWHDTLAVCAMRQIPQDLDRAAMALRLPQLKDKEGSKLVKSLSKPNKQGRYDRSRPTMEKVYEYCRQDVRTEAALHARVGWLPPGERSVWLLDQRINERGVRLDLAFVQRAQEIVDKASVPLLQEFSTLTGGLKPSQGAATIAWAKEQGADIPNLTKETVAQLLGGDDDDEGSENDDPDDGIELSETVRRALTIRATVGSASVKKLSRMAACVCADGRARGLLQYHGAGPGRWAGRLLQPQNFPRGTLKQDGEAPDPQTVVDAIMTGDPEWVQSVLGPPIETVVGGLRHAIIAAPGRLLVSGDFAQIEARLVLALAGQDDKLELFRQNKSPYIDMAQAIYKRPIDKKKDPAEYLKGKNSVLGLGFQMGANKFFSRYCKGQSLEFATGVVTTYRKEWAPLVPKVWYALDNAAVKTVHEGKPHEAYGVLYQLEDGWLSARIPSGRKLWYFNPQPIRKAMPWDDTDIRLAWTYQAMKLGQWKTIDAFGGLLTENVVQALARDLMCAAMFKAERNGMPIVLTVHDEIVCEPLEADADELALAQIMCDMPDWAKALQLPVATETWTGERYRK